MTDTSIESEKKASFFTKLYTGTGAFGIVANRRKFYVLTVVIVAICLANERGLSLERGRIRKSVID